MKSIGYYVGCLKGTVTGFIEGRRYVRLSRQYGGIENIPTRDLLMSGPSGQVMVRRQRVKIAAIYLRTTLEALGQPPIPNTLDLVSNWLDFIDMGSETMNRVENISSSTSIIHALIDLAVDLDHLDKDGLYNAFVAAKKEHVWEQYRNNDVLLVS